MTWDTWDWPTFFIALVLWAAIFTFGYWIGRGGGR